MKKLFLKLFILSAIVVVLLFAGNKFFKSKTGSVKTWTQFYDTDDTNFDVIITGNSIAYASFDPRVINKKLKTNAFTLASGGISLEQVYFNIQEMLKYHMPKTLVLEAHSLDVNTSNVGKRRKFNYKNVDGQKLSFNKLVSIYNVFENKTQMTEAMFPVIRNHNEWTNPELLMTNAKYSYQKDALYGYRNLSTKGYEKRIPKTMGKPLKSYEITEENKVFLNKINSLCKENNIELLLVRVPQIKYQSDVKIVNDMYQYTSKLAKELGITYVDFNKNYEKLGFIKSDFYDALHLNTTGAKKASTILTSIIDGTITPETEITEDYVANNKFDDELLEDSKSILDKTYKPFDDVIIEGIYIKNTDTDIYDILVCFDKTSNFKKLEDYKLAIQFVPIESQIAQLATEKERKRRKMSFGDPGKPFEETSSYLVRNVESKTIPITEIESFIIYFYNKEGISERKVIKNFSLK